MDRQDFIKMLNKDLADEHASILRYLIHAYQVGEATPFGSMLLSTAREEMWHMNWLGDELGELGEEPDMRQGEYPHDPTSNASLLRSYIEWERNLVTVYDAQAAQVDNHEMRRILQQLGWESVTHLRRFQEWLERLGPEGEKPFEYEDEGFSAAMLGRFHKEVDQHYKLVLQHLRHAFVFEEAICPVGSEIELSAMRHMKHLSHFAETLAESGESLPFDYPGIDMSTDVVAALSADLLLTKEARERFIMLGQEPEVEAAHELKVEIDNMVTRNGLLATVVQSLLEDVKEAPESKPAAESEVAAPQATQPEQRKTLPTLTVGSLIKKSDL